MCKQCNTYSSIHSDYNYCPICGEQLKSFVFIDKDGEVIAGENKTISEKEIFELFLKSSNIPKDDIIDYRYCTEFYVGFTISNAIIIQLNKKYEYKYIVYSVYDGQEK